MVLRVLNRLMKPQPFRLTFSIVPNAIRLTVTQSGKPVAQNELLEAAVFPETAASFFRNQFISENGTFDIPFGTARRLIRALRESPHEQIELETGEIDALKPARIPQNFQVEWKYDRFKQQLVRTLHGADGYIGSGCFYRGVSVWRFEDLSEPVLQMLGMPEIAGADLFTFVKAVFPELPAQYFRCELQIETGFSPQLKIGKPLKSSVNVQIVSNSPDLQRGLRPLRADPQHLVSGSSLIPYLGDHLRERLLKIAASGEVTTLEGESLVAFIKYDLTTHAAALGVEREQAEQLYEMFAPLDAVSLPLHWRLQYGTLKGIGRYTALPYLGSPYGEIPLSYVEQRLEAKQRFCQLERKWVELTPAFQQRFADWKAKGLREVVLFPQEVMGANRLRLSAMQIDAPTLDINLSGTEAQQALQFLNTMRTHGVPAGIFGLQQEITDVVAGACKALLQADKSANILWLVSSRRKGNALDALRRLGLRVSEPERALRGSVTLSSLDKPLPRSIDWALIIFTDIDLMPATETHLRLYAALQRTWSICTFARSNWHQDEARAGRTMRILGLLPRELAIFREKCTRTFTDQPTDLITRLTSPFKQLIIGEDKSDTEAFPIPRRADQPPPPKPRVSAPPPLKSTEGVFHPTFADMIQSGSRGSFLEQARMYEHHIEAEAEPVPFMHYFPTYTMLSTAQKRWYFYWRSQVRAGKYLHTDLSYIFLHVYEILHTVGFSSPQAAFDYLVNLWEQYRTVYPRLDGYLVDWLADFIAVYELPQDPMHWYAQALAKGGDTKQPNLALEAWLMTDGQLDQIPKALLDELCQFNYDKTKFYEQHNQGGVLDVAYRQALAAVDRHLRATDGKSLFQLYRPRDEEVLRRVPFASAVYEGKRDLITIGSVPRWKETTAARAQITWIVRYTDTLLRRQRSYKGKTQAVEIPPEWAAVLDQLFPAPVVAKSAKKQRTRTEDVERVGSVSAPTDLVDELTFDYAKIDELHRISESVRDRLLVEDEEEDESPLVSVAADSVEAPTKPTAAEPLEFITERPADAPAGLWTDLKEVAEILAHDVSAVRLLRFLQERGWESDQALAERSIEHEFLNVVLDRLNERAQEIIGDNLISIEDEHLSVAEDYRDELEFLFAHPVSNESTGALEIEGEIPAIVPTHEDLEAGWAEFAARLQSHHWEALSVLLAGENVIPRLDDIARRVYTTANLLIDEINDFALASIEDIVIDAADVPFVEDEDIESMRQLLAWALENIIKE